MESVWQVTDDQIVYYIRQFVKLQSDLASYINPLVARDFFSKSRLQQAVLGAIWDLADVGTDGVLSLDEFCIAMHLTVACSRGVPLPPALPPSLLRLAGDTTGLITIYFSHINLDKPKPAAHPHAPAHAVPHSKSTAGHQLSKDATPAFSSENVSRTEGTGAAPALPHRPQPVPPTPGSTSTNHGFDDDFGCSPPHTHTHLPNKPVDSGDSPLPLAHHTSNDLFTDARLQQGMGDNPASSSGSQAGASTAQDQDNDIRARAVLSKSNAALIKELQALINYRCALEQQIGSITQTLQAAGIPLAVDLSGGASGGGGQCGAVAAPSPNPNTPAAAPGAGAGTATAQGQESNPPPSNSCIT